MSEYQVTNYGMCGECRWAMYQVCKRAFSCANKDSDYYTDYIAYTDTCDCFEQRGIE